MNKFYILQVSEKFRIENDFRDHSDNWNNIDEVVIWIKSFRPFFGEKKETAEY